MDQTALFKGLAEILEIDPGEISMETDLEACEMWDSISIISFIGFVNESSGIDLDTDELGEAQKVSDLMGLIEKAS